MIPLGIVASGVGVSDGSINDHFNRADGAIGTTDTGQAWTVHVGTWSVVSNAAGMTTGSNGFASVDWGVTDMKVSAKIVSNSYPGLTAHYVDTSNYYMLEVDNLNNGLYLGRWIGGARSWLATNVGTVVSGSTYTLTAQEVTGKTALAILIDGVSQWTGTDTSASRPMGTRAGLRQAAANANGKFDDFRVETP